MVRHLLIAGLVVVAPPALAQVAGAGTSSDAFVDQVGDVQAVTIAQQGAVQAAVVQRGREQTARVSQKAGVGGAFKLAVDMRGLANDVVVTQGGEAYGRAVADVRVAGVGNMARIAQFSYGGTMANAIALAQTGNGNRADLSQSGSGNAIDLLQERDDNHATISQTGSGLGIKMVQSGGAAATVVQTGP